MGYCQTCGNILSLKTPCACGTTSSAPPPQINNQGNAYLSSGFSKGITKGLKTMLDHPPTTTVNETCIDCLKNLTTEDDLFVGHELGGGHTYCQGCYSDHYKKADCAKCSKPVLGLGRPYVVQDGRFWHKECFDGGKSCHGCMAVIFGEAVEALDCFYHPGCFNCFNCHASISIYFKIIIIIDGPFVDMNGEPCCKPCVSKIKESRPDFLPTSVLPKPKNSVVGGSTANSVVNLTNAIKTISTKDDGPLCSNCNTQICNVRGSQDNGITLGDGKSLHARCFNCESCKKSITANTECKQSITLTKFGGTQLACTGCKSPISSSYMKHESSFFHPNCFKCSACATPIGLNGYMQSSLNQPICAGCKKTEYDQITTPPKAVGGFKNGLKSDTDEGRAAAVEETGTKSWAGSGNTAIPAFKAGLKANPGKDFQSERVGLAKDVCPFCKKKTYLADRTQGPFAVNWHRGCLRCGGCRKQLDSGAKLDMEGGPFCLTCFSKK